MNKKIISILSILFMYCSVLIGCDNTYKIKDTSIYNAGYEYFAQDANKDLEYTEKLERVIYILDGDFDLQVDLTINNDDGSNKIKNFGRDENIEQYNDYKYGILKNIIDDLNNKRENGIEEILIKNKTSVIEFDELIEEQKELYNDEYVEIIDGYLTVFTEIYNNYNGENIDKSYEEKINELSERYNDLKNKTDKQFSEEVENWLKSKMPVKIKGTIKFK